MGHRPMLTHACSIQELGSSLLTATQPINFPPENTQLTPHPTSNVCTAGDVQAQGVHNLHMRLSKLHGMPAMAQMFQPTTNDETSVSTSENLYIPGAP